MDCEENDLGERAGGGGVAMRVRGDGVADCAGGMRRDDIDGAHGGAKPDGSLRRGVGAGVGGCVCRGVKAVGKRGRVHSEVDGEMNQSKKPICKKSMLQTLNLYDVMAYLEEISENGDMYGYDGGDAGYYQEYKEQFDELADGAYNLLEALDESEIEENWDDMAVAMLGYQQKVLGFDAAEDDYCAMLDPYCENLAVEEATKRIERLTKQEMIRTFRKVLTTLILFFDIKAAHDCLTSIVQELDYRGAILNEKSNQINKLYEDLTGQNGEAWDSLIANIPQRMWVE